MTEALASVPDAPSWFTLGNWQTEEASAAAFDTAVSSTQMFRIEREVRGTLLQPRAGQVERALRIDRILFPAPALVELGWRHGAIGVEIKRSGVNIGPPIGQALDYVRAAWDIRSGVLVQLSAVFIWPASKQHGPLASVMCSCRVGTVTPLGLRFALGEEILFAEDAYRQRIRVGGGRGGRRTGSR